MSVCTILHKSHPLSPIIAWCRRFVSCGLKNAIVDYEAEYKKLNKIKYLNYIARVMEKYYKENENFDLRLIVIYTGDVKSAEPNFETKCLTLRTEQAFLSHIDGEAAFNMIRQRLPTGTGCQCLFRLLRFSAGLSEAAPG